MMMTMKIAMRKGKGTGIYEKVAMACDVRLLMLFC